MAQLIMENKVVADVYVYKAKSVKEGLPFIDLTKHKPETASLNSIPAYLAHTHKVLPVRKEGQTLYVAMLNPRDIDSVDAIRTASGCAIVRPMSSVPTDIEAGIKQAYPDADSDIEESTGTIEA